MTKQIEILDALPGSGKTTAIFQYMASHQTKPWLYLSPMKDEINERVPQESDAVNMAFHVADYDKGTLAPQILELMREGKNIACTHALTLHFKQEHIDYIKLQEYQIVCDEELNLIDDFKVNKQDMDFLYSENMLSKDIDNLGKMKFLKQSMSDDARYGDIKRLCDRGCLYGEKNSNNMLVTYLSPDLILSADRFILLTYNFGGSVMQAFLALHNIEFKQFSITLYRDNNKNKSEIKELIEFVEPVSVKKFLDAQTKFNLSSAWWDSKVERKTLNPDAVRKLLVSLPRTQKVPTYEVYYTIPMSSVSKIKCNNLTIDNLVACNCRATNKLAHKTYAIHAFNIFNNVTVKSYLQSYGFEIDEDGFALNQAIQWIFRGCIRERRQMKITFLSKRMRYLFMNWLDS